MSNSLKISFNKNYIIGVRNANSLVNKLTACVVLLEYNDPINENKIT
jgi:hypothetical protein